jgi:hypothetical protein
MILIYCYFEAVYLKTRNKHRNKDFSEISSVTAFYNPVEKKKNRIKSTML